LGGINRTTRLNDALAVLRRIGAYDGLGHCIGVFTAYLWLIHHESPTKVVTYAYVNPVVAVLLGYFLGGESFGLQTILGALFVLISVVVITTTRSHPR